MNWKSGLKGILLLVAGWVVVVWRYKLVVVDHGSTGGWLTFNPPTLSPNAGGGPLPVHPAKPKSNRGSAATSRDTDSRAEPSAAAKVPVVLADYPLRAIVIGDWGTGLDTSSGHNQKGVAARLATLAESFQPALVVSTGDQMWVDLAAGVSWCSTFK